MLKAAIELRATLRVGLGIAVAWVLLATTGPVTAQTAEQLDIFRNLTPEQQRTLMDQLSSQDGRDPSTATRMPRSEDVPVSRRPAAATVEQAATTLQPEDTLTIELSLPSPERELAAGEASPVPAQDRSAAQRRQRLLEALDRDGRERLENLIELVMSRNPYQLDREARLNLPGFAPIALGGLSEEQAAQRLSLEPVLLPLELQVFRLPLAKTGVAGLKPFGYDLFNNGAEYSPLTDVPVPADYVVGPGDILNIQLFGSQNRNLRLTVNRDGSISFPELGPIRVGGQTFSSVQGAIQLRVAEQMLGVQANVSMGDPRTISVFVVGEVERAGSYTVSGLATMTTALFAAGGVKPIGSLRNIQLRRQGQLIRRLDLYDLLTRGDTSGDARLLPGDVILIPPVGATVAIDGEVRRPAIYELRDETGVADVLRTAGGLKPEADPSRAHIVRIDASGRRVVVDINVGSDADNAQPLRNGDVLRVARLRPQIDAGVTLEGFVHRPGAFAWREGLRLTDVISSVDELKPSADQRYVLVRREAGAERRISFLSADLAAALAVPGSADDLLLLPRDRVLVFDLAPGRERIIGPLLDELQLQAGFDRPTEIVRVGGRVKAPGEYPLEPGMRISDLLRAGGNLDIAAFSESAELMRYVIGAGGTRQTELIPVDLSAVRRGDAAADLILQSFDHLIVKETPDWAGQEAVVLRGEVRFPGTYPIRKGETLRQLLERAGGLTTTAFPEGGAFTRSDLKELEQQQLDRLSERLRGDLAALALQSANAGQGNAGDTIQIGQSLLSQLNSAQATGRFIIDLPALIAAEAGSAKDIELRDGDELFVPRRRQEVTVIGEVQNATSHLFLPDLTRSDYIAMSGGTSKKADNGRIYVVRADGRTAKRSRTFWSRKNDAEIKPGDTIVVPLDTERMPRLPFWQAVTQILYNVAVSIAAVNSF